MRKIFVNCLHTQPTLKVLCITNFKLNLHLPRKRARSRIIQLLFTGKIHFENHSRCFSILSTSSFSLVLLLVNFMCLRYRPSGGVLVLGCSSLTTHQTKHGVGNSNIGVVFESLFRIVRKKHC